MNMPLTIGIENGIDKGFTKEELGLTNGFALGAVCMHAGVGRIGDAAYRTVVSVEETHERFKLVLDAMPLWEDQENSAPYKWLTNLDNIKRLEANDWSCNVGNKSREEFLHHMKNIIFDNATRDTMFKYAPSPSWEDIKSQKEIAIHIVGSMLKGYELDNDYIIDTLVHGFELFESDKPFYDGLYLRFDENDCVHYLSAEREEE
tara:strand:+ start:1481 stop:2092 length:612 start_codon:yes stop_codon:yes gene_type:complete